MEKTEEAITRQITKHLKATGWFTHKIHGGPMQQAGMPDLLAVKRGRVVFMEIKRPSGKLTRLQEHRISELRNHGAEVHVVYDVEDVKKITGGGR